MKKIVIELMKNDDIENVLEVENKSCTIYLQSNLFSMVFRIFAPNIRRVEYERTESAIV